MHCFRESRQKFLVNINIAKFAYAIRTKPFVSAMYTSICDQNFAEIPSFLEKDCITFATVQELFKHFEDTFKFNEEISDDCLIALDSLFGETLEKALDLVETSSVKFFHTNSLSVGVFQVEGRQHNSYYIFPLINYCPCLGYKYQVAGGASFTCKHVLASIIAKLTKKVELVEVTPLQLHNLILTSYVNE